MKLEPSPIFVVQVVHHLLIGGMENGVVNLVNRLPSVRFRHAVVCIEDYSDFRYRIERPDVEVHAMHRSRVGTWGLRRQLYSLFRRLRPDIVHTRNLSGLDALLPARLAGIRTVHSEHGFDVGDLLGQATRPMLLRRLHAPLVGRYVTVSRDLQRVMSEQWGIAGSRITQIYNGVDTDKFCPGGSDRREPLPESFRGEDAFVVGTVGRARPVKDQATLLRAAAAALQRRPSLRERLRVVVVGEGPSLDELVRLAASLAIQDLTWFAGARDDVAQLLRAMDLFVLPSLNEGISNTLLEAMATGLPLLATAVGGNVELVERGVVGECVSPSDVSGLAGLIEAYASDPSLCARHGAAARRRAIERFSLESMVSQYRAVYEAAVRGR